MSNTNIPPSEIQVEAAQIAIKELEKTWLVFSEAVTCAWNIITNFIITDFMNLRAQQLQYWKNTEKRYRWYAGTHTGRSIKKRIV